MFSEEMAEFSEPYPVIYFSLLVTWFSTSNKSRAPEEVTQNPKEEVILIKNPQEEWKTLFGWMIDKWHFSSISMDV